MILAANAESYSTVAVLTRFGSWLRPRARSPLHMVTAADLSENMLLELSDDGQARPEGQLEGALSGFWTAHATRRQIGGAEWCFLAKPYYMATPLPAAGPMRSDLLKDDFTEDDRSSPVDECSSPVDECSSPVDECSSPVDDHTTFIIPVATSAYHTHEMPAYKQYASDIRTAPHQALLRV
ncbi:hypothetical protein SCUP515_08003 [Seiridium cupressi]